MKINYYTYKEFDFKCDHCNWTGKGSETKIGEVFEAVFEIDCPKCGEPVDSISHPTTEEIIEYGSEEEKKEAREIQERLNSKVIPFANDGTIDPLKVKEEVYKHIDFDLPDWLWEKIDSAFGKCWNNEIGLRGWIHENQIETAIAEQLKQENILFEHNKLDRIVKIMLHYIETTGGFLDQ